MKKLLVGVAFGAMLIPAMASAQDRDHNHGCLDEDCSVYSLFQDAPAVPGFTGWQGIAAPKYGTWGFDPAGMDPSVLPGDSFMRYANGAALDRMTIPADRSAYGSFNVLADLSENRMKAMIDGLASRTDLAPGSDEQKIADAYRSYMDVARIEALDAQPLAPYLAAIRAIDDHEAMAAYMGVRGRLGGSFFATGITIDQKSPNRYVVSAGQGGLGMPNRDFYLLPVHADKKAKYQVYVAEMLTMIGWDDPVGSAEAIVAVETAIAEAHWTPIESRNRDRTYNESSIQQLVSEAPGFDWVAYFEAAGLADVPRLVARQNTAMPAIAAIFAATPIETLRAWQAFHTTDAAAGWLSTRFETARWGFYNRDLAGQPEQRPRDKRGIGFTQGMLGEAMGRQYVADYFPAESKAKMEELVANLVRAQRIRIENLTWMSAETKAAALDKLAKFTVKIGYPERWRDYSALAVRADDLFGNGEREAQFQWNYQLARLNQPVDKAEWGMTPQTVNAYYNSANNEIVFPAAILQPPFFDPDADPAVNYGAIGGVIGHEIGHGFDDQGRKSDGDGVLRDWWTPADAANFTALTTRLGAQYDTYEVAPGHNVQGALSMGENIGDASGVAVGLEAYRLSLGGQPAPVIDGWTGEQRFFFGWAQVWQTKSREEALKRQVAVGPHSPAEFRVIGPLRNVDAWYDAFNVQPGTRYYLAPEDRVRIW
ncbi:MAG: M13-type metalloendopeptidase [Brevundimonas sp.]|uniref:M13 family metallopeptidase n=1 Tax=Brevundimonas sp. TaxID=1871086 RepID=UPI002736DD6B|nr:M13-type metalloendopeptidase [Brevundimonas sp.]MDP3404053.1 M13-type metalloendopeptidase [Brevundimonas sp.]